MRPALLALALVAVPAVAAVEGPDLSITQVSVGTGEGIGKYSFAVLVENPGDLAGEGILTVDVVGKLHGCRRIATVSLEVPPGGDDGLFGDWDATGVVGEFTLVARIASWEDADLQNNEMRLDYGEPRGSGAGVVLPGDCPT